MDADEKILDISEPAHYKKTMFCDRNQSCGGQHLTSSGCTAVLSILGIVYVTHGLVWAECTIPYIFIATLPLVILYKLMRFRKNPAINDDLSYIVNIAVLVFLWLPFNSQVFQMLYSIATGPVLVNTILVPDTLLIHNPDNMSSIYLHWAPAIVLFCIRWYSPFSYWPLHWWKDSFYPWTLPDYDHLWCFALPMAFIFIYTLLFWFMTKFIIGRYWNIVPVYSLLQTEESMQDNSSPEILGKSTWTYFSVKCLECLIVLILPRFVYDNQGVHWFIFIAFFLAVTWKGGSTASQQTSS